MSQLKDNSVHRLYTPLKTTMQHTSTTNHIFSTTSTVVVCWLSDIKRSTQHINITLETIVLAV